MCLSVCVPCACNAYRVQKGASNLLALELQAVVSHLVGAGSSATVASVCNSYQAISPAPAARNFNSVPVYGYLAHF